MSPKDATPRHSLDGPEIARLRGGLLGFFDTEARDLPWRDTRDPYAIWICEVMSQQTRIETVVPYWRAWMDAFPTVRDLAEAEEATVLKAWEGLGYYSRARNLHRAAKVVRETLQGRLPGTREGLRALPGIGAYTSGAVASIAFREVVPAVDGNVRRVASRILDWPDPRPAALEAEVARWVPEDRPGDFNQALMEFGATFCTPRAPRCHECPVSGLCRARAAGTVSERPAPRRKATVRTASAQVRVAWRPADAGGEFALRRRPREGLLGGMYEFPATPMEGDADPFRSQPGTTAGPQANGAEAFPLPAVPHTFSHLRMVYHPMLVRLDPAADPPPEARWFASRQIHDLPLPVAQQSILAHAREALARLGATGEG
jgi:A/G-specific adenine glycosylase